MKIYTKKIVLLNLIFIIALFSCNKNVENDSLINSSTDSFEIENMENDKDDTSYQHIDRLENRKIKPIEEYDTIKFGNYYINDESVKEPIEWYILNIDKKNQRAMLLSKYAIDSEAIDSFNLDTNFYFTKLGVFLNNSFINEAFDADEVEKLLLFYEDNYFFGIYDDINHYTRVSLLSTDEIIRLLPNASDRMCYPTKYAESKKIDISKIDTCPGVVNYWLRNKGLSNICFQYIYYSGKIDKSGKLQTFDSLGVRPIIWIDMSSFLPEKYEYYLENAINIDKLECKIKSEEEPDDLNNYKVGDTFYYGHHYDFDEKKKVLSLLWEVVDKDIENDKILVINKYPSYCEPYNNNLQSVNWEKSSLRKWLNDDFYKYCFTDDERERILKTRVSNTFNYKSDKETNDYIYIMSRDELDKYYPTNSAKHAIRNLTTISTESIAKYEKKYASDSDITRFDIINAMIWNCNYWVRDVIMSGKNALNVNGRGEIDTIGEIMTEEGMQVRPCMWLDLQNSKDEVDKSEVYKENIDYNNYLYIDKDAITVRFGRYKQDSIDKDINDTSYINWIIIDRDKSKNEATLMSEKILEFLPYKSFYLYYYYNIDWYSSTLRWWLNSAFYNAAFNEEEKAKLVQQHTYINDYYVSDDEYYQEKNVYDSVTVPSHEELSILKSINKDMLNAQTTKYGLVGIENIYDISDINKHLKEQTYRYWQRDTISSFESHTSDVAYFVVSNGQDMNSIESYAFFGVRPVIKVKYYEDKKLKKEYESIKYIDKLSVDAKFKDIIEIGHINQENLFDNSSIEWIVLKNDTENRQALLISKKILDYYNYKDDLPEKYDSEELNNLWRKPWRESKIKEWLNNQFINTIFTKSEIQNLVDKKDNGKLFMLSIEEIEKYIPIISLRKCTMTRNANLKLNSSSYSDNKYVRWFPRDSVVKEPKFEHLYFIDEHGKFDDYTYIAFPTTFAIRPAIWMKY